jgi:hypothetical protein
LYFASEFFHEVGNVDLADMMPAEDPENANVQSFVTTLMALVFEQVLSKQMANI